MPPEDDTDFNTFACNPDLPEDEEITTEVEVTGGEADVAADVQNCTTNGEIEYVAPEEPGIYVLTATFTFSDSSTCIAIVTITVEE